MTTKAKDTQTFEFSRDRRAQVAKILETDQDKIGAIRFEMRKLRQLGVLVDIDVRGFSMFSRAASFAEWGIADADLRHSRLKGGVKFLVPKLYVKRLRSLEQRFRQLLERYSPDIEGFRPYRWVSYKSYPEFKDGWNELQEELVGLKRELLKNYPRFVDALAEEFSTIADKAWKSIKAQKYDAIEIKGREFRRLDDFREYVVSQAVNAMPAKARIEEELFVDYRVSILENDADLESELQMDLESRAKLEAMRQAEMEHAREQLSRMASPVQEAMAAVRSRVAESVAGMLKSIKKNGFVRGKIAEQGAGLLEFYDLMSVVGDNQLRAKLATLKQAIGPIGKERGKEDERDLDTIKTALEEISELASQESGREVSVNRFSTLDV